MRTITYYALLLGHDRTAEEVKLRELINGAPTVGGIAEICRQFNAHYRLAIEKGRAELA